LTLGISKKCI